MHVRAQKVSITFPGKENGEAQREPVKKQQPADPRPAPVAPVGEIGIGDPIGESRWA